MISTIYPSLQGHGNMEWQPKYTLKWRTYCQIYTISPQNRNHPKSRPLHNTRQRINKITKGLYVKAIELLILATLFNAESTSRVHTTRTIHQWDTSSDIIEVDNICSAYMSQNPSDFTGDLHEYKVTTKGFGGQTHYNVHIGNLKGHWEYDKGKVRKN